MSPTAQGRWGELRLYWGVTWAEWGPGGFTWAGPMGEEPGCGGSPGQVCRARGGGGGEWVGGIEAVEQRGGGTGRVISALLGVGQRAGKCANAWPGAVRGPWGSEVTWGWRLALWRCLRWRGFPVPSLPSFLCHLVSGSRGDAKTARDVRKRQGRMRAAPGCLVQECCLSNLSKCCPKP